MSTAMRELIRTTLGRSLYVAAAFALTLAVYVIAGQAPARSFADWIVLGSVLSLLALLAGALATSIDLRQR